MSFFILQKMKSCFLRFCKLAKNEIHVFWAFLACKRWKPWFLSFCKLAKKIKRIFLAFQACKKLNEIIYYFFFLVFTACKKRNPYFLSSKNMSLFFPKLKKAKRHECNFFCNFKKLKQHALIFASFKKLFQGCKKLHLCFFELF